MKNPLMKESHFQNGFYYFGRNKREKIDISPVASWKGHFNKIYYTQYIKMRERSSRSLYLSRVWTGGKKISKNWVGSQSWIICHAFTRSSVREFTTPASSRRARALHTIGSIIWYIVLDITISLVVCIPLRARFSAPARGRSRAMC